MSLPLPQAQNNYFEDSFERDTIGFEKCSTPLPSPVPSIPDNSYTPSFRLNLDDSFQLESPTVTPVKRSPISRLVTKDELLYHAVKGFGGFSGLKTLQDFVKFHNALNKYF